MIELEDQEEEGMEAVAPLDTRLNVKKKTQIQVAKDGKPGTIAHTHKKENEFEEWDEPCYFVEHIIKDPAGFKMNETLFKGKLIVPQCTADYLAWRENTRNRYEQGIYRSKKLSKRVASL
jgi:hypothetical protein